MQLVIAEKPSVAQVIAKVLGAGIRKEGYLEGNGYQVSWCVGHLIALCDAYEYHGKYKKWRYDDLPIVPDEWKYKVLDGTKKQYNILKKLMNARAVTEVVCATDAGREGELIFRLVYEQAGCKKPVKRLWISSMEETAIKKGFCELKDGNEYDALYESALCRSKADWLVGINASRLFSVLYGKKLTIGRVQTPTLAMIVERNQAAKEFRREKYYLAHLTCNGVDAVSEHLNSREEAEKIANDCKGRICQVEKENRQKKTVKPPKLYDLTSLQRECNRIFGYTAQQTLDYTQNLYEKKLVTYPRTDSQYLTEDMEDGAEDIIWTLLAFLPFAETALFNPDVKVMIDSGKVTDHHAIIPTREVSMNKVRVLPEGEKNVLLTIAARLLEAASASHIYESVKCELICNGHTFYLNTKKEIQEGYTSIEKEFRKYIGKPLKEEPETEVFLTKTFGAMDTSVTEQQTQPPRPFTEDTLLLAMERAGCEDMDKDTEKKGIGTPATRAGIIEKLVQYGFVQRNKKNLIPTDDGIALITVLPEEICSAKMTAEWESCLSRIAEGKGSPEAFMNGIASMLETLVGRYRGISEQPAVKFSTKEEKRNLRKSEV